MSSGYGPAWSLTKELWFLVNSPSAKGLYRCHYCKKPLTIDEVTLDHILQASRYPQTKYDISNLIPACRDDNNKRGEQDYDVFARRFYPELLKPVRPVRP